MRHEDAILPWHPFLDHRYESDELRSQLLDCNGILRILLWKPAKYGAVEVVRKADRCNPGQLRIDGSDISVLCLSVIVETISTPTHDEDTAEDHHDSRCGQPKPSPARDGTSQTEIHPGESGSQSAVAKPEKPFRTASLAAEDF